LKTKIQNLTAVRALVGDEVARQDAKYGDVRSLPYVPKQMHVDAFRNYSLMITSEANAKSMCERHSKDGTITWSHVLIEEVAEAIEAKSDYEMMEELIQVAAVAINWAAHLVNEINKEETK